MKRHEKRPLSTVTQYVAQYWVQPRRHHKRVSRWGEGRRDSLAVLYECMLLIELLAGITYKKDGCTLVAGR